MDELIHGVDNSAISVSREKDRITVTVYSMGPKGQAFTMIARLDADATESLIEKLKEAHESIIQSN